MQNIILYGMRGSGKTTIGKELSHILKYDFFDLDLEIEKSLGEKINVYIDSEGWDKFRNKETEILDKIISLNNNKILSLGLGTILFEKNRNIISKYNSKLVYIYSNFQIIRERILNDEKKGKNRNSLTGENVVVELEKVYNERKDIYEKYFDIKVNNDNDIKNCTMEIIQKLKLGLK